MKKRLIALLLCAVMVLSVLPLASAEGGKIEKITINGIPTPTDGAAIPYDSSTLIAAEPQLYKAYYWNMSWRVSDGIINADLSPTFEAGELYTLTLLIVPQNGATGLDETTAATLPVFIGGQKAKYDRDCKPSLEQEPGKEVFAYDVELRCAWTNEIRMIDVYGMILPATGAEPDVSTLSVPEDAPYTIADAAWWRYTTMPDAPGDEIRMEPGEKFVEGTWYYLDIDLVPKEGYFFASSEECYWRINGTASLTDEEWSRSSGTGFDLFSADFQATSRHIDIIELNGMTETLYAGDPAKTAFENVTIPAGAGYTLVTDRKDVNVSKDSNDTYIKDDDLFEAGESYKITLRVAPKDGWTIDSSTVWRINGRMDLVLGAMESTGYWYCRSVAIPATARTHIDRVQIFGVTDPVEGWMAIECTTTYVANGPYELVERYWFDDDDDLMLIGDDAFELGKHYMMCNVVKPYEGYVIDDSTVFELNGGDYAVELSGGKPDGSYYVWTEPKEPLETCSVCWYLNVDDEMPVAGVDVIKGDVFGAPAVPAKDGYIFGGWFTDKELTKPYDPAAPILEDTNLYPLWIPVTTVTAVDAKIAAPAVGQKPSKTVTLTVTPSDANIAVENVYWRRWNDEKHDWDFINDPAYTFEEGERYGVDVAVKTGENTVVDAGVSGTINGEPGNANGPVYESKTEAYLSYNWDKLPGGGELNNPFVDVGKSDYFYDAVLWAYYHDPQVTNGLDATHFGPYATCTRGQIVTFLWRALGEPAPTITKNPFVDVKTTDYYYKAVLWAYEKGVTTGTDATHFAPNAYCKREHAVAFLYRAAGKPAYSNSTNPFVDVSSSAYYYDAVLWAVEKNITKGMDEKHFGPSNSCQRCQIVTFLYRFMNP